MCCNFPNNGNEVVSFYNLTEIISFYYYFFICSILAQERYDRVKDFASFSFSLSSMLPHHLSDSTTEEWEKDVLPSDPIIPEPTNVGKGGLLKRQRHTIGSLESALSGGVWRETLSFTGTSEEDDLGDLKVVSTTSGSGNCAETFGNSTENGSQDDFW